MKRGQQHRQFIGANAAAMRHSGAPEEKRREAVLLNRRRVWRRGRWPICLYRVETRNRGRRPPQRAESPPRQRRKTPVAWGALRPMARLCRAAPRLGGGRGEAAAGTHPRPGHGAATGTGGAAHPAAGTAGGPASCDGKQGAGDARRQARAAHPRRAARSQPAGGPTGPVRWWGLP